MVELACMSAVSLPRGSFGNPGANPQLVVGSTFDRKQGATDLGGSDRETSWRPVSEAPGRAYHPFLECADIDSRH